MTPASHLQRILTVEPHLGDPGQHPKTRHSGATSDLLQTGSENGLITAEFVDDVPGQQGTVRVVEQRPGAEEAGEHSAAVNVPDEHHRQALLPCQSHVRVVTGTQVDLGRGARTLADDHVVCGGELVVGGPCGFREVTSSGGVLSRFQHASRRATQHDEGATIGARFEQHRIHG